MAKILCGLWKARTFLKIVTLLLLMQRALRTLGATKGSPEAAFLFFHGKTASSWSGPPHNWGFTIASRHTTLGRTPLDERSHRRREIYLITHNWGFTIASRHTTLGRTPLDERSHRRREIYLITHTARSNPARAGFDPAVPGSEQLQTHALDRAPTGTGKPAYYNKTEEISYDF